MSVAKSIGTALAVRGAKGTAWHTPNYSLLTTHFYWCPVNASNSVNIRMFEWYKPHSLDDTPERG